MYNTAEQPDLCDFFITNVSAASVILSLGIESKKSKIGRIEFQSYEAFQFYHESDFYSIFSEYELVPFTPVYQGDWAVFRVVKSPFYSQFCRSNGRLLNEFPCCFLVATADEHIEVITFERPIFS
jgi:hypothetical protein